MTQQRYGVGIGWRREIAGYVAGLPGLRFAEAADPAFAADAGLRRPAVGDAASATSGGDGGGGDGGGGGCGGGGCGG